MSRPLLLISVDDWRSRGDVDGHGIGPIGGVDQIREYQVPMLRYLPACLHPGNRGVASSCPTFRITDGPSFCHSWRQKMENFFHRQRYYYAAVLEKLPDTESGAFDG